MENDDKRKLNALKARLPGAKKEHQIKCTLDSLFYNGGTAVVLLATTLATVWTSARWPWLPKALTAFATFWVALDRGLNFGRRWRFHLEMKNGYRMIEDMIDYYEYVPENKKEAYLESIWQELKVIRSKEPGMPIGDKGDAT